VDPCSRVAQTGDANGDCTFNVIDIAYTMQYVVESLVGFTGTYGAAFNSRFPSARQITDMDADRNGVVDNLDANYMTKVAVQRSRWVRSLTVTPCNDTLANGCVLTISATVLLAGNVADSSSLSAHQTIVYFNLVTSSSSFNALFQASRDNCTRCMGTIMRTVSHSGSNNVAFGGFVQALARGAGVYTAAIQTDLVFSAVSDIGLSVVIITLDGTQQTDATRIDFLQGPPQTVRSFTYSDRFTWVFPVRNGTSNTLVLTNGYSPFMTFRNTMTASSCINDFAPLFSQSLYNVSVVEHTPVNTTIPVNVSAIDRDLGLAGMFSYSLVHPFFAVDSRNGSIRVTADFDRLWARSYLLNVTARDSAFPFRVSFALVSVTVLDAMDDAPIFLNTTSVSPNSPLFLPATNTTPAAYVVSLSGLIRSNTSIAMVAALNPDVGNASVITYVFDGPVSGFVIDNATGLISTTQFLVRDTTTTVNLTVRALQVWNLSSVARVQVTFVVDFPFVRYSSTYSGFGGTLTGTLGSLQTTIPYSAPAPDVPSIRAVLVDGLEGIYSSRPTVRVALQARDEFGAVPAIPQVLSARVTPGTAMAADLALTAGPAASVSASCSSDATNGGICLVTVTLPPNWFSAVRANRAMSVEANFADGRVAAVSLGTLNAMRAFDFISSINRHVFVQLPYHALLPGETASIPVYAHTTFAVAGFRLSFTCASALIITSVTLDTTRWTAQISKGSNQQFVVNAFLLQLQNAPTTMQAPSLIAMVNIQVSPAAVTQTTATFSAQILDLLSVLESPVLPGGAAFPVAARIIDRFYDGLTPAISGRVVIGLEQTQGVLASIPVAHFINTARLNGLTLRAPISVWAVSSAASVGPLTTGLSCFSSTPNVVKVASNCSFVFLDGSETTPTASTSVSVAAGTFSTTVAVRVWTPILPIRLELSPATSPILPINGWLFYDAALATCRPVLQRPRVSAFANFTFDGVNVIRARVTDLVIGNFASDNAAVRVTPDALVRFNQSASALITVTVPSLGFLEVGRLSVSVPAFSFVFNSGQPPSPAVTTVSLELLVYSALNLQASLSPFVGMETLGGSVTDVLLQEDQPAGVVAVALFSDGTRMQVTPAMGLQLSIAPGSEAVLRLPSGTANDVTNSFVIPSSSGTATVFALWRVQCDAPGARQDSGFTVLATGSTTVRVNVPAPVAVNVTTASTTLTLASNPAAQGGVPVAVQLSALLAYDSAPAKDLSADVRLILDFSEANGLFSACPLGITFCSPAVPGQMLNITAFSGVAAGTGVVIVRFVHTPLVARLNLTVVLMTALRVQVSPFPAYPGHRQVSLNALQRYRNDFDSAIVRQSGVALLLMTLSNGTVLDLGRSALVNITLRQPGTTLPSTDTLSLDRVTWVLSVIASNTVLSTRNVQVDVVGWFGTNVATPARLTVTNDPLTITEIAWVRPLDQAQTAQSSYPLSGVAGGYAGQMSIQARFSDGSQHANLFSSSGALLPGLVSFSSDNPSIVSVNGSGALSLRSNSFGPVSIAASITPSPNYVSVQNSVLVTSNMLPDVGDVDLGGNAVAAIPPQPVGTAFAIPIYLNSGPQIFGALDLQLSYDPSLLTISFDASTGLPAVPGTDWPGGIFEAVVDPPGFLNFGGSVDQGSIIGARLHIATVTFTGRAPGTVAIQGVVNTMARKTLQGTTIGAPCPRPVVAGNIQIQIVPASTSARRRRQSGATFGDENMDAMVLEGNGISSTAAPQATLSPSRSDFHSHTRTHPRVERRNTGCASPPCDLCPSGRAQGDTNGDCLFDIRDVSFLQFYLAQVGLGSPFALQPFQQTQMDADGNGIIALADALYLARVNFRLLRFFNTAVVRPVQHPFSGGFLTFNFTLGDKTGAQRGADLSQVLLYVTSQSQTTINTLAASTVVWGTLRQVTSSPPGILFEAQRLGPLYASASTFTLPDRCLLPRVSGLTCTQTQPSTRFFYNYAVVPGACQAFQFNGCGANENNFMSLEECAAQCIPSYAYSVRLNTTMVASGLGLSLLMVTFDSAGSTSLARNLFFSTQPAAGPYVHQQPLSLSIPISYSASQNTSVTVLASNGFSPLSTFSNTLSSLDAINNFNPTVNTTINVVHFTCPDVSVACPGSGAQVTTVLASSAIAANVQTNATTTFLIRENNPAGILLGTLAAWDRDPGQTAMLVFSIISPGAVQLDGPMGLWVSGPVSLDPFTGAVYLNVTLDFELIKSLNFTVSISDNAPPFPRTTVTTVSVIVMDANDNVPQFVFPIYGVRVSATMPARTLLTQLSATDTDSNTALGGPNNVFAFDVVSGNENNFFQLFANGTLQVAQMWTRELGTTHTLVLRVRDAGTPPLTSLFTLRIAVVDDSSVTTLTLTPGSSDFLLLSNTVAMDHPCIGALAQLLQANVSVTETIESFNSVVETQISFVASDVAGQTLPSATVVSSLLQTGNSLRLLSPCALTRVVSTTQTVLPQTRLYMDSACTMPTNATSLISDLTDMCGDDRLTGYSVRTGCQTLLSTAGTTTYAGRVDLRAYPLSYCNGQPTVLRNVPDGLCVQVSPPGAAIPVYAAPRCASVVLAAAAESSSSSFPLWIVVGAGAGGLLVLVVLLLLLLRYRRQQQQLKQARMMVLAHQGDVAFDAPPPAPEDPAAFSGGEIDPRTGEVTFYKSSTTAHEPRKVDLASWEAGRNASLLGTTDRSNPLFDQGRDTDSLMGDLDELDEFQEFQHEFDAVLAETRALAHGGAAPTRGKPLLRGPPQMDDDDSLSDFENEHGLLQSARPERQDRYADVHTDSEDDFDGDSRAGGKRGGRARGKHDSDHSDETEDSNEKSFDRPTFTTSKGRSRRSSSRQDDDDDDDSLDSGASKQRRGKGNDSHAKGRRERDRKHSDDDDDDDDDNDKSGPSEDSDQSSRERSQESDKRKKIAAKKTLRVNDVPRARRGLPMVASSDEEDREEDVNNDDDDDDDDDVGTDGIVVSWTTNGSNFVVQPESGGVYKLPPSSELPAGPAHVETKSLLLSGASAQPLYAAVRKKVSPASAPAASVMPTNTAKEQAESDDDRQPPSGATTVEAGLIADTKF
jgi:hypothetical protein